MKFEWDLEKEIQNIRKHRISFTEAVESFLDPHGFQLVDIKHSLQEKRLHWVGRVSAGRVLTTQFTKRGSKILSSALPNGESFGGFTMKQPDLSHLKVDRRATKNIRAALSKKNRVTITVSLDMESLKALQTLSKKSGIPYQRLLNTLLTSNLTDQESIQSRLDRLEQELRKIKRHVAA